MNSPQRITREAGSYYNMFFPLFDGHKQNAATLVLGVKTQLVGELIYRIIIISMICLIFSVGLVYFFISRHITEPVLRVERGPSLAVGDPEIPMTEQLVS